MSCGHYLSSSRSWEFTTAYAPHGANIENAAVILAVGSDDLILPVDGIENAVTAMEAYAGDFKDLGKTVIVLGGGLVGCEAAADYLDRGIKTTIVEMQECLMPETTGLYRTAVHGDRLWERRTIRFCELCGAVCKFVNNVLTNSGPFCIIFIENVYY